MVKKVGPAGSFGARYGKRIRELWARITSEKRKRHICPYCKARAVKWVAVGIYICKKCGAKFTGKAYTPY